MVQKLSSKERQKALITLNTEKSSRTGRYNKAFRFKFNEAFDGDACRDKNRAVGSS